MLGRGVHIAGNMHLSPLLRYVNAHPTRLTAGRTRPAPTGGPSVTYPAFTALPDGTLLFWRREGRAGEGNVLLDALDPGESKWGSLGAIIDGSPTGESPYLNHIAVDPRHRSHPPDVRVAQRTHRDRDQRRRLRPVRRTAAGPGATGDGTPLPLPITHHTRQHDRSTPSRSARASSTTAG